MKVSYSLASGGGWIVLVQTSDGVKLLSEFQPNFKGTVQQEVLYGSAAQFRQPQGNVAGSLPLDYDEQYASAADALASIRIIGALQDQRFHIKVEEGAEVQFYPNACIVSYNAKLNNVSCRHTLQFATDNVTGTAPS